MSPERYWRQAVTFLRGVTTSPAPYVSRCAETRHGLPARHGAARRLQYARALPRHRNAQQARQRVTLCPPAFCPDVATSRTPQYVERSPAQPVRLEMVPKFSVVQLVSHGALWRHEGSCREAGHGTIGSLSCTEEGEEKTIQNGVSFVSVAYACVPVTFDKRVSPQNA